MVSYKSFFLLATAAVAAAAPQYSPPAQISGFELLYSDLQGLDLSVKQLTTAVNLYMSGATEASPIFTGVQNVNVANRKSYNDAMTIPTLNFTQSEAIVNYVSDPIAVDSK